MSTMTRLMTFDYVPVRRIVHAEHILRHVQRCLPPQPPLYSHNSYQEW